MSALPSYVSIMLSGFGEVRDTGVQRTEMESGPPKQLKVKSRVLVTRDCVLRVASLAEYLTFITWFETTINFGADWFDFADPVTATTKSARIVTLGRATPDAAKNEGWRMPASIETWSA